jgi:putative ABC transport system permease protein
MSIPIMQGRGFTPDDRLGTVPVAVVSDRTARRFWPDGNVIGQRVRTTQRTSGSGVSVDAAVVYQIVGVVGDVHFRSLDEPPGFDLYVSAEQTFSGDAFFVLRTSGDPASLTPLLGAAVRDIDPNQSIFDVRPMAARMAAASWQARASALVLTVMAAIGLVLAAVGTYGVLAYAIALRRREIGVRAALGADAAAIRRMVLGQGLQPVAAGVAVGAVVTLAGSRAFGAVLHEVSPIDPVALLGAPLVLATVAAGACLLPAARAARADPAVALRAE